MKTFKSKKDLVVEVIRDAILSGELEPGARLMQDDLAERLQVSSTPVREALRQLETEGILQSSPNRGMRVAEVDLRAVREIYLIRADLEALATRMAAPRLSAADLHHLKTLQAEIEALIQRGELKELRRLNYELHNVIYRAAGLPELLKIIHGLWTKFPWDTLHVLPNRAFMSADEHAQLIRALEESNAALAGKLMREHIESGARALDRYLADTAGQQAASADGVDLISKAEY
jgi:DNA-binding GntR family transcriptional regulator